MALLGTLQVRMGLDTADLKTGIGKVPGMFSGLGKSLAIGGAAAVGLGVAAIAGAKGLFEMVQSANDLTDGLNDSSTKLGIAIGDLQIFEASAKRAGLGAEGLEALLKKMNKTTGEIKLNESTADVVAAFSRLGISVSEVKASNPAELFQKVISGLDGIHDPAVKAATAMQIFGKQGQDALVLAADGAEGLKRSRDMIEGMGLALTQVDAAKVGEANDALDDLGTIAQAAKQKLGATLAPAISSIAEKLLGAGKNGFDFGKAISDAVDVAFRGLDRLVSGVTLGVNAMAEVWHLLESGIQALASVVLDFGADTIDVLGRTIPNSINGFVTSTGEALTSVKQGFHDFGIAISNSVLSAMDSAGEATTKFVNGAVEGLNKVILKGNEMAGTNFAIIPHIEWQKIDLKPPSKVDPIKFDFKIDTFGQETKDSFRDLADLYDHASEATFGLAQDNAEQMKKSVDELFSTDGGAINQWWDSIKDKSSDTAKKITDDYSGGNGVPAKVGKAVKEATEKVVEEFNIMEKLGTTVTDHLDSAISDFTKNGQFSLKKFTQSLIQDFAAIQLKAVILGGILGNQKFGGDGQGIFGSGQTGSLISSYLSGFSGAPKAIPLDAFGNPTVNYTSTPGGGSSLGGIGSIIGGVLKLFSGFSFEGGGFTGAGSRTGGVDGRGGFPALLHPNETVTDHTKVHSAAMASQKANGRAVQLSVPVTVNPGVSREELAMTLQQVQTNIIQIIPALIQRGGSYAAGFAQ